ncbi:sn-glycerol-3-phosphate ABC transporter ATP-binding protein UgpC [Oscillospiraceae bacterium MB08-C2-2]|nr:sn-glycerol-3-phosphate ABC transporter ATP-binding protein UgpC [Oscillospiraceae bacterium MB08-C2-2]
MASITLEHVYKIFPGNVTAAHDFNLEIADKEFIVLVGPSGCGKSTVLRMIAGLEEVTDGEIHIGEKLINNVAPKDRDIAMVFQNYALYPHMTVYKNMAFSLQLRKVPSSEIKAKVNEAAQILDIEHLLQRKPKELSGGQRQRVALGRAMVRNPAAFLLDEPLSNLDAKLRAAMRAEITKLHHELEATFIYVTHDQTEAMTMGDRIVVMKDGFIQQIDTPQDLYDYPCNVFVAEFIGSPQMNMLPVIITQREDGWAAMLGQTPIRLPQSKIQQKDMTQYDGQEAVLGIRPESLYDDPAHLENPENSVFQVKTELVEMMGSEIYLYGDSENGKIIARLPAHSHADHGATIQLAMDTSKIHLFDKESGLAIFH